MKYPHCADKDGQFVRLKRRKFYVDGEGDVNGDDKTARKLKLSLSERVSRKFAGEIVASIFE